MTTGPFFADSAFSPPSPAAPESAAAFHPIVTMGGRSEGGDKKISVIVLVLDAVTNEAARKMLLDGMRAAFERGRAAVRDWKPMLARLQIARDQLAANPPAGVDVTEDLAFLDWLADNHFTFLGTRDYLFLVSDGEHGRLAAENQTGLGVLSDQEARVIAKAGEHPVLTGPVRAFLDEPEALIVTKAIARSFVHRRTHMDYVGIKIFGPDGKFVGEHRFVGLFTSGAYSLSPRAIPLLRQKIAAVMTRAGLIAASHDGKALAHILDTFPRDELFQISEDELFETAMGILKLGGRPRVKLFLRWDRFDRFVSALLFAPRDHVTHEIRDRIHAILARALNGRLSASTPAIDESALVRIHYIIGRNEGARPDIDIHALEREIEVAIKTWDDFFLDALCARYGRAEGLNRRRARRASSASARAIAASSRPMRRRWTWRRWKRSASPPTRPKSAPMHIARRATSTALCASSSMSWAMSCPCRCRCRSSRIWD